MSRGNSEFLGAHLVGELIDLLAGVTEDNSLSDVKGLLEIAEGVEFVVFTVDGDVELADTFQSQFVFLD